MDLLVRLISTADVHTDLWLSLDPQSTVRDVLDAIRRGCEVREPLWLGADPLIADQAVVKSTLRSGAVLTELPATVAARAGSAAGSIELRVVAGPGTGLSWRLNEGSHALGRGEDCVVRLPDDDRQLSRSHAVLIVEGGKLSIQDTSANGVLVDGERLKAQESRTVALEAVLQVGRTVLSVSAPIVAGRNNIQHRPDGSMVLSRTFREEVEPLTQQLVRFPSVLEPSVSGTRAAEAALLVLGPLALAAPIAVSMGRPSVMLVSAGASLMYGGNLIFRRRSEKRQQQQRQDRRSKEVTRAEQQLDQYLLAERERSRSLAPDTAALVQTALLRGTRLWECREGGPGAFSLRIGVHDQRAVTVRVEGLDEDPDKKAVLAGVPATVSLPEAGVLGVAGRRRSLLLRSLVLQLAVLHSPADLMLAVVAPMEAKQDWDWVRWLPHLRQADGTALLGTSTDSAAFVVQNLVGLLEERERRSRDEPRAGRRLSYSPRAVLLVDDLSSYADVAGLRRLAEDGPQYGINIICGDDDEGRLMEQRTATIRLTTDDGLPIASLSSKGTRTEAVLPDLLGEPIAEQAAMSLAPLSVEREANSQGAPLPSDLRFTELLKLNALDGPEIKSRWTGGKDGLQPVPVGLHGGGDLMLDLVANGPHAVVVGASGSGKSEFLTTLVTSLAMYHSPDQLALVLVDFKGGTGLEALKPLPHTAGLVTNLDSLMAVRALNSLEAELRHRQEEFNKYGEQSFEQVVRAAKEKGERPLPRLLVLVDEFAVLMKKLPDLVGRLEEIALTGRSLGVHMVLATQQPFEISEKILNNSGLRVVLFVEDPSSAQRLLKSKAAEGISKGRPGRAAARVGDLVRTFQTARTTTRRRTGDRVKPVMVRPETWERPLRPVPPVNDRAALKDTDLYALVNAAIDAHGDKPRPTPVFQKPLQDLIPLDNLRRPENASPTAVPFALEDRPDHQDQVALMFDPADGGLLIMGGPNSGRSTALRTLAAALAHRIASNQLHLHGIEAGAGQLTALEALPHTGVITRLDEPERVDRLLELLVEQAVRRTDDLQRRGFTTLAEQWAAEPQQRLPYQVLLIDGWDQFTREFAERDAGRVLQLLGQLVELRAAAGLAVVASGRARYLLTSSSPLNTVAQRLVLSSSNMDDYGAGDIPPNLVPDHLTRGRALLPGRRTRREGDRLIREPGVAQIAVLGGDPTGPGQRSAFRSLATELDRATANGAEPSSPIRIDPLPSNQELAEALELTKRPDTPGIWALAGVGGDQLAGTWVDLLDAKPFVIAGPEKSGRTTALHAIALSLLGDAATRVVIIDPRRTLADMADHPTVLAYHAGQGARNALLDDIPSGGAPVVVLVDDIDRVPTMVDRLLAFLAEPNRGAAVAGTTESLREWEYKKLLAARSGLLLHPRTSSDGDLFGQRLQRHGRISRPKGRGHLITNGETHLIQVPQA